MADESQAGSESLANAQSLFLREVCQLPIEARAAAILGPGREDITTTLKRVQEAGAPISMGAERVAWAVAFNVVQTKSKRNYQERWPPQTPWQEIWSQLVRPLISSQAHSRISRLLSKAESFLGAVGRDPAHCSLLGELTLSVACEQRDDWQPPTSRPLDVNEANRAFEFVYARDRLKVERGCTGFGKPAGAAKDAANEAWAVVFCDYWSDQAKRRFLGLSQIPTLLVSVARKKIIDAMPRKNEIDVEEAERISKALSILPAGWQKEGPEGQAIQRELGRRIRECLDSLTPKRRLVVEMVWIKEKRARDVAQRLHISEAAVSQHLSLAREHLRKYLQERGFEVPE